MASLSCEYMIIDNDSNNDKKKAGSVAFNALIHSTAIDLTAMLIATRTKIDRLPIFYLSEAKA
ncbi:MAG: hypothetical protein HZC49_14645 [Nitrospirae bacterium]|nr:hypothetical protein [Nitrospirota bacterium]